MTTKAELLAVLRRKCLECCCHQPSEVKSCHITVCELWPYRFGSDPSPSSTRGFAKQPVYTGDLKHGPLSGTSR